MGRLYVNPTPEPEKNPEDDPVQSGRLYIGSTDAAGVVVPVVDTTGEVVRVTEPGDPDAPADSDEDPDGDQQPAGNASTEEWADYARSQGATDEDLVDDEGKPLGRDALRDKYGSTGE